jgi:transposase-like protein
VESSLTDTASAAPARDRRSFADAEKLVHREEAEQPGVSAAAVCRRHNIATSMIVRCIQFSLGEHGQAKFATMWIANEQFGGKPESQSRRNALQVSLAWCCSFTRS